MADLLVPVVVVMRDTDLAYLNSIDPGREHEETFKQLMELYGWTDEALMLGSLLGAMCDMMRRGDMDWEARRG